jgi:2-(1,2-epoxy-1,2-dihydrophenyl)acetyl-CoA isomerase
MSRQPVHLDIQGSIATLTLDDPARLNPLSRALVLGALDAVQTVRDDKSVRVLVLRGAGRGFCTGADLSDFPVPGTEPEGTPSASQIVDELLREAANPLALALRELPVPVLASVHGAVAGGGVGLALAADVVVAAKSAFFYLPFVPALGLVPDLGGVWYMLRALGPARTAALTLLGDRLGAQQAADWGLIWACVDDDELAGETSKLAARLAALPPHGIGEVRALLQQAAGNGLAAQLDYERGRQRELMADPCFGEGLRAFMAKRRPVFPGC